MPQIIASVIIPSYNGKEKIVRLLQSIAEQSYADKVEILVVIDGSTDHTASILASMSLKIANLHIIEQENKGRAGARNTGAQHAASDLLIFFDDDMLLEPTCIDQHVFFHKTQDSACVAMGKIIEPSTHQDAEIVRYKHYLNTKWDKNLKLYEGKFLPDTFTALTAQNCSLSKKLFFHYKGFDERLKDIEDYDFALRIKKDHIPVFYLSNAVAIHKDAFTFSKYASRAKDYYSNRQLAARLKPDLYQHDRILGHRSTRFQLFIYAILSKAFWLTLLDKANFLIYIVPRKIRYKFYDLIITGYSRNL